MIIDAALLEEVESSADPRTIVRFYQWRRPTVSLGRSQKIESAVDPTFCAENGIDIVHRPTGGRVVLHDDELTYAVVSNVSYSFGSTIYGNYKRVSEALCDGYRRLGVDAILAPDTRKPAQQPNGADPPCFLSPSRYELMINGRKIVGSAQRRLRRSFLQHGSMPMSCDYGMLAGAVRMPGTALLLQEMAGLAEFLPERPPIAHVMNALIAGFQQHFAVDFRRRRSD
jgi:lipoate-protein ligase A